MLRSRRALRPAAGATFARRSSAEPAGLASAESGLNIAKAPPLRSEHREVGEDIRVEESRKVGKRKRRALAEASCEVMESGGPGAAGQKRGFDVPDNELSAGKRSRTDEIDPNAVVLKILVPGHLTGQVIGKQGVCLNRVMDSSGARCRVSLMDEVIPQTGERICTVTGTLDAICRAQRLISDQMADPAWRGPTACRC